ncbi:MAG: acetyl-CoA carboxylase carboxyltransferase subunit beta [Hyphomonadaceae bacterium]|nr:acetyl-CoA carboxylase carboxyltransferase subunit beta [Hyphomonadaceae bacterium]
MSSNSWWHNVVPRGFQKKPEKDAPPKKDARLDKDKPGDEPQWVKCPQTNEILPRDQVEEAHWVTPAGFHMRIGAEPRFKSLFDGKWTLIPLPKVPADPLKFKDDKKYVDRLKAARAKTGREDCMTAAIGRIGGQTAVVLVQDFEFMGGSLGLAAGEAFVTAAETAVRKGAALIVCTASGGARMQEGVLSLMQMPRTTLAIQDLHDAALPYIVVLCDPTSGGVTASYAMLGDVHIAEPGAMIAFSGPRVIEQTIRQKLPDGFQRAEYLLEKGMVDMVVPRGQMRETIGAMLSIMMAKRAEQAAAGDDPELPLPPPEEIPVRDARKQDRTTARQRPKAAE